MSNLRHNHADRLSAKRARQLTRVALLLTWHTDVVPHLMNQKTLRAVNLAWQGQGKSSVNVILVSPEESQSLNAEWRGKDYATNVLSFPFELPEGFETSSLVLGDLVICPSVLLKESAEQHKSVQDHFAHLLVHGLLHLQGYDHETDVEAEEMESLEVRVLQMAGFGNPYQ
jgi:probable rRNA maturation factor